MDKHDKVKPCLAQYHLIEGRTAKKGMVGYLRRFFVYSFAMTGCFALYACSSVGPEFQPADIPEVQLYIEKTVQLSDQEKRWWQLFEDERLTALVTTALQKNNSLKAARANVTAAFALFKDLDNDDLPKAALLFGANTQKQITPGFSDEKNITRSYRAGSDLRWSLDLFGKLDRAAEAAMADAQAEYWLWRDAQLSLVAQVAKNYASLLGNVTRLNVAQDNIQRLEKMMAIIEARIEEGFASELDRVRIIAQLKGVQASVPQLRAELGVRSARLSALIGGEPNRFDSTINSLIEKEEEAGMHQYPFPQLNRPLAIGAAGELLKRRTDIRVAEKQLQVATATIGVKTADLYPNVSVTGFLGFLSTDLSTFDSSTQAWSIAPSLTWSIFDRGSVRAQIKVANARQEAAVANFEQVLLNSLTEAQAALVRYTQLQKQLHFLEAQVKASESAVELAMIQYEAGSIDLLAVLEVERNLLSAKDRSAQAMSETFIAIIEVYRAFGGELEGNNL